MTIDPTILARLAHDGLVPTSALTGAGYLPHHIRATVRAGQLTCLRRGWYAVGATPGATELHRLRVRALRCKLGARAVPMGVSALVEAGLPTFHAVPTEVTFMRVEPGGTQDREAGLVIHPAPPAGLGQAGTALLLALAVIFAGLEHPLGMLIPADAALRRGLLTTADLELAADLAGARRGIGAVRAELRHVTAAHESPGETVTDWMLRGLGYDVEPQFLVPGTERLTRAGRGYRADGRIRGTRVLVEFDGRTKYGDGPDGRPAWAGSALAETVWDEKLREDAIRDLGWEVVRLTWRELQDPEVVRRKIDAAIARAAR